MVGTRQASLPVPTAAHVPPCCHYWAQGVQPCYLPGEVGVLKGMRPRGGAIYHGSHQP